MNDSVVVPIDPAAAEIIRDNIADVARMEAHVEAVRAVSARIASKAAKAAGHDLRMMLGWKLATAADGTPCIEMSPPPMADKE